MKPNATGLVLRSHMRNNQNFKNGFCNFEHPQNRFLDNSFVLKMSNKGVPRNYRIQPNKSRRSEYTITISSVIAVFITNNILHPILQSYNSIAHLMDLGSATIQKCRNKEPEEILEILLNAWVEGQPENATTNNLIRFFGRLEMKHTANTLRESFASENITTESGTEKHTNHICESNDVFTENDIQQQNDPVPVPLKDKSAQQPSPEQQQLLRGSESKSNRRSFTKLFLKCLPFCSQTFGKKSAIVILLTGLFLVCAILASIGIVSLILAHRKTLGPLVNISSHSIVDSVSKPITDITLSESAFFEPQYTTINRTISVYSEADYKTNLSGCHQIQYIYLIFVLGYFQPNFKILCPDRVVGMKIIVKDSVNYTTLANIIGQHDNVRTIDFDVHAQIVNPLFEASILGFMFPKSLQKLESISIRCKDCNNLLDLLSRVFRFPKVKFMNILEIDLSKSTSNHLQEILTSANILEQLCINGTTHTSQIFSNEIFFPSIRLLGFNVFLESRHVYRSEEVSDTSLCSVFPNLNKLSSKNWFFPVDSIKYCLNLKEVDLTINDVIASKLHSLDLFKEEMPQLETLRLVLNYTSTKTCPNKDFPGVNGIEDEDHLQVVTIHSTKCPLILRPKQFQIHIVK